MSRQKNQLSKHFGGTQQPAEMFNHKTVLVLEYRIIQYSALVPKKIQVLYYNKENTLFLAFLLQFSFILIVV